MEYYSIKIKDVQTTDIGETWKNLKNMLDEADSSAVTEGGSVVT